VAVGIYLPLSLSTPILAGGLVSLAVARSVRRRGAEAAAKAQGRGLLFSSGLVAGEAVTGVILAALIFSGVKLPVSLADSAPLSLLLFFGVIALLARKARKE